MVSLSLMSDTQIEEMNSGNAIYLAPDGFNWSNYSQASESGYWAALGYTSANVFISIVFKIIITMCLGYAFSLKKWRGKKIIWRFLLALLVLPEIALLSGQFQVVVNLGLRDSITPLVLAFSLPFVASIFNALMYRNAFEAIPSRIKEVAYVDGATGIKYFFKVAVPMVVPTTLTVVILTALAAWNAYLWVNTIKNGGVEVLSTWLFLIGTRFDAEGQVIAKYENISMAGAIIVILPMIIVYFIFRSKIMNAISKQGATIKG